MCTSSHVKAVRQKIQYFKKSLKEGPMVLGRIPPSPLPKRKFKQKVTFQFLCTLMYSSKEIFKKFFQPSGRFYGLSHNPPLSPPSNQNCIKISHPCCLVFLSNSAAHFTCELTGIIQHFISIFILGDLELHWALPWTLLQSLEDYRMLW